MFDAIKYFTMLTEHNRLAAGHGFLPVTVSGPDNLEGLFEQYRDHDRFVAVTDTNSGNLMSPDGTYGFMKVRVFTVFILSGYEYGNMESRQQELELCRELFRQFASRILHDKKMYDDDMMNVVTNNIPNQELGRYYLSGMTGLFFQVTIREPVSLEYRDEQWT